MKILQYYSELFKILYKHYVENFLKKLLVIIQILEVCNSEDKISRHNDVEEVKTLIKEVQYYAMIRQKLSKR